jgi:hypothetical protein
MLREILNLHSLVLALSSAPAPAFSAKPNRGPPAVCQIQDSLRRVEPGSFGLIMAVLARTSLGDNGRRRVWIPGSALSQTIRARH